MSGIFFGKTKAEVKKEKKAQEESIPETIEEALSVVVKAPEYDHKGYSIAKINNKFRIILINIEISSLQTEATMLPSVYDHEYQAVVEMNRLFAEQARKFRSGK